MLTKLIGKNTVAKLFLFSYSALAIGLPFNKIVLSLATMLLFLLALLELNPKRDWEAIKRSKILQVLLLFLLVHLLSFFWSSNTAYFLKDLNSKLPFYSIPLVFVLHPLTSQKELKILLGSFLFSIIIISLINFISYFGWRKISFDDVRSMSLFLSHIRFGLMLVLGIVLCGFWIRLKNFRFKWIPFLLIAWFLVYTYYAEVFSAYLALVGVILVCLFWYLFSLKNKLIAGIFTCIFIASVVSLSILSYHFFTDCEPLPKLSELDKYTKEGNPYSHDLSTKHYINNTHVYTYVCAKELVREWPKVSKVDLMDTNQRGYINYYILVQYMASKGLRKDAEGFKHLSAGDIRKIEQGIHTWYDSDDGFFNRMETLKSELYDNDPNGKTMLQRLEYLSAGSEIFKRNLILGIGSGDLQDEFDREYLRRKSKLKVENRLRAHNQFLTYFISFGLIGGLLFIFLLGFSSYISVKKKLLLPLLFLTIIILSFLSEDTLETQMGGTFFALFFGLFISSDQVLKSVRDGN